MNIAYFRFRQHDANETVRRLQRAAEDVGSFVLGESPMPGGNTTVLTVSWASIGGSSKRSSPRWTPRPELRAMSGISRISGIRSLMRLSGFLCLVWGTGCAIGGGDEGGDADDGNTATDGGVPGEGENDPDEGHETDTQTDTADGDAGSGAPPWPDGGPPALDPESCELGYAPEALASFETSGAMAGVYNFFYDEAGNLVHFFADITSRIDFDFEYEDNRLVRATRTTDDSEVYEATYEYDASGLPTAVYGRNRSASDESWLYSMIEFSYEDNHLFRKISWRCEAEGECREAVIDMRYFYDDRGLLAQTEYTKDGLVSRWARTYDDDGNLLSNLQILADGEETYRGNIYAYEDDRLVWREVHEGEEILSAREYYYEDDRLSISIDPETGRYTQFDWTENATACSLLRTWQLPFLHFELGDSSQEMLIRLYGYGRPTGLFY